jgi:hypothetical protein
MRVACHFIKKGNLTIVTNGRARTNLPNTPHSQQSIAKKKRNLRHGKNKGPMITWTATPK